MRFPGFVNKLLGRQEQAGNPQTSSEGSLPGVGDGTPYLKPGSPDGPATAPNVPEMSFVNTSFEGSPVRTTLESASPRVEVVAGNVSSEKKG